MTSRSKLCATCEEPIDPGERVHRDAGVVWHTDCDPPRNLSLYRRERDRGPRPRRPRHRDIEADYYDE